MTIFKKITPKTLRILFGLGALGCIGILILSYLFPRKTLFDAQTLSSLTEESYYSEPVDDNTSLELYLRAYDISVEYIGLYMRTDTRVLEKGNIHYDIVEKSSQKSVASGDLSLAGTGDNSFLLLPVTVSEPLEGEYHLLLTFSDIDPSNAPAFWITTEEYKDFSCCRDGKAMTGNIVAILYNYSFSRPLVWDSIFILCVLGTVYLLIPKNPVAVKEGKS